MQDAAQSMPTHQRQAILQLPAFVWSHGSAALSSCAEPWVSDVLHHLAFPAANQIKMQFCFFSELTDILINLQLEVLIELWSEAVIHS